MSSKPGGSKAPGSFTGPFTQPGLNFHTNPVGTNGLSGSGSPAGSCSQATQKRGKTCDYIHTAGEHWEKFMTNCSPDLRWFFCFYQAFSTLCLWQQLQRILFLFLALGLYFQLNGWPQQLAASFSFLFQVERMQSWKCIAASESAQTRPTRSSFK